MRLFHSKIISRAEVDTLFRDILNQDQIYILSVLLNVLGIWMFVDRDLINMHARVEIGLSYLKKAINYGLVTEYTYTDNTASRPVYYYQLNTSGKYFLDSIRSHYNDLPLNTLQVHREQILTFNKFASVKNYILLTKKFTVGDTFDFFICKDGKKNVVCFYEHLIKEKKLAKYIRRHFFNRTLDKNGVEIIAPISEVYKHYRFEPITFKLISIGNKTSGHSSPELYIDEDSETTSL